MASSDRRPLDGTPVTRQITGQHNNRLGAVYSSLYSFWMSRLSAVAGGQGGQAARRDAYSVIFFNGITVEGIKNDFTSSPDQLLASVMQHRASGGTDYSRAIECAQEVMTEHWSTERFVALLISVPPL